MSYGHKPSLTPSDLSASNEKYADDTSSTYSQKMRKHGVHWLIASVLLVGEMAGGGLVALPGSFVDSGLVAGIVLTFVSAIMTGYTGVQLGLNWLMMQDRWPEYRSECKKPYPEMAYRAWGRPGRIIMSIVIAVQQFGLGVVFLLLASTNISAVIHTFWQYNFNFCYIALILCALLAGPLMLESPKDFWQAGVVAMVSTSCAIVLIFVGTAHDQPECMPLANLPNPQLKSFFLAYGTIMFAYGGHSVFPTIQHDMKQPAQFTRSVILCYTVILVMYMPVSIYAYLVYGDSLYGGTVTLSLQLKWTQQAVNLLITIHALFTEVIILSPLSLEVEALFKIRNKFGLPRVIARTLIIVAILIVALTIPRFGPLLDLIGGTTITCMTRLMPGLFYISLVAGEMKRQEKAMRGMPDWDGLASIKDIFVYNKWWILIINAVIIIFGLIGGIASTISAVEELTDYEFQTPCYIAIFQNLAPVSTNIGTVHCCGKGRDHITIPGENFTSFCVPV